MHADVVWHENAGRSGTQRPFGQAEIAVTDQNGEIVLITSVEATGRDSAGLAEAVAEELARNGMRLGSSLLCDWEDARPDGTIVKGSVVVVNRLDQS